MNIGIIGCGLIGNKRARSLGGHNLAAAVDLDLEKAKGIARLFKGAEASQDVNDIIKNPEIDLVIVATTNDKLSALSVAAAKAGKHVLVEKPAGRNPAEVKEVVDAGRANKVYIKAGFNHRYHPSLLKAKEIIDSGKIGELMFIRGRYGHGGRIGYEKEWRNRPEISGGGELIDQGVHLIDLSRWLLGEFTQIEGFTNTYFWEMPVEDNAFFSLRTSENRMAWLHVSCSEWKNMFSFEIYGRFGKLQIDGLGGSYGTEKLTYYQMLPQMGPPDTKVWEFPGNDSSWGLEFKAFVSAIESGGKLNGDISDAYEAVKIVDKIYNSNKKL